ncbi:zinc finger protein 271-like isoform X1 [Pseudochaenichthys georgianus]|uniref:zinc finger protein 271-like isoform X1 n=1 Tax=Pseudochaenichthys georgianus TaxID=52239 RepID=UPI001469CF90|nr:zinc finger protein 629-like [Pseudochaenichthys georgianus]
MSKVDMLREVVSERLTAAALEIFGLFERTVAEYEEQLCRSKEENERHRKLLDAVLKPEVRLHRAVLSGDVHQSPHIKEEQGQLVAVKSEDDEEKAEPQLHQRQEENSSSAPQMEKERDREDCRGSEPTRSLDPVGFSQPAHDYNPADEQADTVTLTPIQAGVSLSLPAVDDRTSDSSEPETDNSDEDWQEPGKPQPDLKKIKNNSVPKVNKEGNTGRKSLNCSKCGKTFESKDCVLAKIPPFVCSVCVPKPSQVACFVTNKISASGEKAFGCSVCKKQFGFKSDAVRHMRIHTGEKPFSCSVCGNRFSQSTGLSSHMRTHTGEKPYSCSLCPKSFIRSGVLDRHMRVHTGEKPYSCSVCDTRFSLSQTLLKHMRIHTGEKPFSCSVCDKRFLQQGHLTQHMTLHTGEKSFSCPVCGKNFTRQFRVKKHKCVTESSGSQ